MTSTDPRLQAGAYLVSDDDRLYLLVGKEREDGRLTGFYELEDCMGVHRSGGWTFPRISRTAREIVKHCRLVREAPDPDAGIRHLDFVPESETQGATF